MLKAEELRIRNIVHDKRSKQEEVINELSIDGYNAYNSYGEHVKFYLEDIEGIPLTEGWLLRMGGEEDIIGGVKIGHRLCNIWVWGKNIMLWDGIDYSSAYTHLKYVHQLQNLYYALTGTELTIKG